MQTEDKNQGYIPGVCNIGKEEVQRRKVTLAISAIITIVWIALLMLFHANPLWRLLIFIPVTSTMVSFLQVYFHFCVNFGMRGVFNFGKIGATSSPELDEYIRKDRAKAQKMIFGSVAVGVVLAVIYYLLPV